jgi:hypothetical protein
MLADPAPDTQQITDTIELYIDGFNDQSAEQFRRCFHPDAWIFCATEDGSLWAQRLEEKFDEWGSNGEFYDWRIFSVLQSGDLARVVLQMHLPSDPADAWVDIHSLLRIDGIWKDMNKTATYAPRAGWAADLTLQNATAADAPERDEIARTVLLYVDGFNDGDIEKHRRAFHPQARITFTDAGGTLESALIADCLEDWTSEPGIGIDGRIISVVQAGDVANVLLGFDYTPDLSNGWIDCHSLLKLDGRWQITNKTATHVSRAAWAAPTAQAG